MGVYYMAGIERPTSFAGAVRAGTPPSPPGWLPHLSSSVISPLCPSRTAWCSAVLPCAAGAAGGLSASCCWPATQPTSMGLPETLTTQHESLKSHKHRPPCCATTHIPVLHVSKAALLQQQADGAHVAARGRQMQRGAPLGIEDICVMLRVLQQADRWRQCSSLGTQAGGWVSDSLATSSERKKWWQLFCKGVKPRHRMQQQ